jgi:hypothetical protein
VKEFKLLRGHKPIRRWLESNLLGQLQWLLEPVGVVFYMDRRWEGNFYTEELKSMTIQIYNRYFLSYNEFIEINRNNIIFVYEFVDNSDISNMVHYNRDNFDEMPRDIPLIFRGVIRNNDRL